MAAEDSKYVRLRTQNMCLKVWIGKQLEKLVPQLPVPVQAHQLLKKRLPKKMRQVPDYYFMPRLSRPKAVAIYGTCIAAGIGVAMLGEIWIQQKIKEDGGVVWEMK